MRVLLISLAIANAAPAVAQNLPAYDVDADCRASGLTGGACVRQAQTWYDIAKFMWDKVSDKTRSDCVALAEKRTGNADRHARYTVLGSCLEQRHQIEALIRERQNPPRFQR